MRFFEFAKPGKEKCSDQRLWNRSYQQVLFLIMICNWRPTQWSLRTTICYGYCNPRRRKQKSLLYRGRISFLYTYFQWWLHWYEELAANWSGLNAISQGYDRKIEKLTQYNSIVTCTDCWFSISISDGRFPKGTRAVCIELVKVHNSSIFPIDCTCFDVSSSEIVYCVKL